MAEKNQAEWIYEVLGKKKGAWGSSINFLTDVEEKTIKEKMAQYWKEHNNESTEFLVNGAVLCCDKGSGLARLSSKDHGVYTDSTETMALANEEDKSIFGNFGNCSVLASMIKNPSQLNVTCRFKQQSWTNVRKGVVINGKATLDTNSCLTCLYGGVITPVTSGQEYTLSTSYNKYPRFLNDDSTIDELIVKKLLLRNIQQMKNNEIDALIKLGIYLCVCEDANIIKKIICCGYITTKSTDKISDLPLYQHTLLDNFIYVSGWVTTYARFCSLTNKLYTSSRCSWTELNDICQKIKEFVSNIKVASEEEPQKDEEQRRMRRQFLNVKLLETILLAGNLYNRATHDYLIEKLEVKEDINFIVYTLGYYDGELDYVPAGAFSGETTREGINISLQTVYVFSRGAGDIFSSNKPFSEILSESIGGETSKGAAALSCGTTVISYLLLIPAVAAAPFAIPLGFICTTSGLVGGGLDSIRANNESKKSKELYLESVDESLFMLRMEDYLSLYFTFSLRVSGLLEHNESIWNDYEKTHPSVSGQKARNAGHLTKDEYRIVNDSSYKILGKGHMYSINYFDSYLTTRKIKKFNENMKHIKLWNYKDKEYKTISENERMEEFTEISSIEEIFSYMKKKNQVGVYYINELNVVGHDRTTQPTKIIYDYGNGETHIITESGTISINALFEDYLKGK
jgi:hypothetical protein